MKAILMSIQSKWLAKILNGEKTVELRKRFPRDYRGWVYLYCTKGKERLVNLIDDSFYCGASTRLNGKVVARVWVDNVKVYNNIDDDSSYGTYGLPQGHCLTDYDILQYTPNGGRLFAIHFSKLEIFDKPKELGEFSVERYAEMPNGVFPCYEPLTKAPQSWQYVEVEQ